MEYGGFCALQTRCPSLAVSTAASQSAGCSGKERGRWEDLSLKSPACTPRSLATRVTRVVLCDTPDSQGRGADGGVVRTG